MKEIKMMSHKSKMPLNCCSNKQFSSDKTAAFISSSTSITGSLISLETTNFKVKKRNRNRNNNITRLLLLPRDEMLSISSILLSLFLLLVIIPLNENHLPMNLINQKQQLDIRHSVRTILVDATKIQALDTSRTLTTNPDHQTQQTSVTTTSLQPNNQTTTTTTDPMNLVKNNNFHNTNRMFAAFLSRPGQQREHKHQQTTYACEGNTLELTCPDNKSIHVLRANYGRFSLSICNDLGHSNLSVDCHAFRAFLIMQDRCNKKSSCNVIVSTEIFGDPCEGTSKYLEVQYSCNDANPGQQSSSSPQQVAPSPSNRVSSLQSAVANHPQQVDVATTNLGQQLNEFATPNLHGGHKSPLPGLPSSPHQQQLPQQFVGGQSSGTIQGNSLDDGQTVIQQDQQQQLQGTSFCSPQSGARNLFWNFTRAGQMSYQSCPDGFSGRVSWFCEPERLRYIPLWSPDFSQCYSNWLHKLSTDLDQILEAQSRNIVTGPFYQTLAERVVKELLRELDLLTESQTKLFSKDLKRIDNMINQILQQFKYYALNLKNSARYQSTTNSLNPSTLYEELFSNLLKIVSNLFDLSQRQAWIEVQPNEIRQKLELRFLTYIKEAAQLLASMSSSDSSLDQVQKREANVFAGFTLPLNSRINFGELDPDSQQVNMRIFPQQLTSLSSKKFIITQDDQINEFKIHITALKELAENGVTRFLVLDVKKPDYLMIRQQLEAAYSGLSENSLIEQQQSNNLVSEPQLSLRIFGVTAITGDEDNLFDSAANMRREMKLNSIIAQWPISVDFKVSPVMLTAASGLANNQKPSRQCYSLGYKETQLAEGKSGNKCQTLRSNATNHVCRCEQLGFISLAGSPNQLLLSPGNSLFNLDIHDQNPYDISDSTPTTSSLHHHRSTNQGNNNNNNYLDYNNSAYLSPTFNGKQHHQQSVGLWASVFIVLGLTLLVVTVAAFAINAILRVSSQRRLNKKQGFLSVGSSFWSSASGHHQRELSGGPTTGPLVADHANLMVAEPNHLTNSGLTNTGTTTQSSSIVGLTHPAYQPNSTITNTAVSYKTHQQLYAAHYPPIEMRLNNSWSSWLSNCVMKPSRWFSRNKSNHLGGIQHRVIGSTLNGPNSVAYKGQIQNGYSTGLHQVPIPSAALGQRIPLAAPSSSTSSYVSSSAFYEEIGPGNLAKVNTNQLIANNQRTLVDPFKRQQATSADQQQLLSSPAPAPAIQHQHQHQHQQLQHHFHLNNNNQQQQQVWIQNNSQPLDQHQGTNMNTNSNYTAPSVGQAVHKQQLHSDLSQLQNQTQSSSSPAGSQHLANSTTTTTTNPTTPRHYLFASPSAVSAYKSSMSQHNLQHHLQQQQQHHHQHYHQHRFMPS